MKNRDRKGGIGRMTFDAIETHVDDATFVTNLRERFSSYFALQQMMRALARRDDKAMAAIIREGGEEALTAHLQITDALKEFREWAKGNAEIAKALEARLMIVLERVANEPAST